MPATCGGSRRTVRPTPRCLASTSVTVAFLRSPVVHAPISCDATQPGVIQDVSTARAFAWPRRPQRSGHRRGPRELEALALPLPPARPGRKHERRSRSRWQQTIVDEHGFDFLAASSTPTAVESATGLTRTVAGRRKRYDYGRWMFVNRSDDILTPLRDRRTLKASRWRRPRINCIAVFPSRRRTPPGRADRAEGLASLRGHDSRHRLSTPVPTRRPPADSSSRPTAAGSTSCGSGRTASSREV